MGDSEKFLKARSMVDYSKMSRGETPHDIQDKCLKLCADYLGGVWGKLSSEQIVVRRISGGYTNQLYYCGLAEDVQPLGDEPKVVTVRLYGKKHFMAKDDNERLPDMVCILMASEHKIGPNIYGIFSEGEIAEYIESNQFRNEEQKNPILVRELAKKLAQFHSLDVPLTRDTNWFRNYCKDSIEKGYKDFPIDDIIKTVKAENFIKNNIKDECEWLFRCLESAQSPIVFSHNDFRGSNMLVHKVVDESSPRRVTLCDFEYSCYYYRGFDFAVGLDEFGRTMMATSYEFPADHVLESFLREYSNEMIRIHGEEYGLNEQNSMNRLIKETKTFALAAKMFPIMFLFSAHEIPFTKVKNDIMVGANIVFGQYLQFKEKFAKEGVLPKSP